MVVLASSAAASSWAPSSPIALSEAREGRKRGGWARRARVRRALGAGAPTHAPCLPRTRVPVRRCRGGARRTLHLCLLLLVAGAVVPRGACGQGAPRGKHTCEVQRGEARVSLERGGQLLGPLVADLVVCGTRGRTRAVWARYVCERGERVRGVRSGAALCLPTHACMRVRACRGVCGGRRDTHY